MDVGCVGVALEGGLDGSSEECDGEMGVEADGDGARDDGGLRGVGYTIAGVGGAEGRVGKDGKWSGEEGAKEGSGRVDMV